MPGDTGAPGENIQASGSISRVLSLPFVFVLAIAVVALLLKGVEALEERGPDLPLVVDALLLVALGGLLFYGAFRVSDWIRG